MRLKGKLFMKISIISPMTVFILLLAIIAPDLANSEESLAKQSQNPVGDIISVPFENNLDFGVGPEDTEVYTLNLKPFYSANCAPGGAFRWRG